ncbi:MAG: hypothetical protein V4536_02725 [Pseudomonadota bacterium]
MNTEILNRDYPAQFWADFTEMKAWLSKDDSLGSLGKAVGMSLELISQEYYLGPKSSRLDFVCKNRDTSQIVIIKNQYGALCDADLGVVIRGAAGLNASAVIWLAMDVGEDYVETVHWLNEHNASGLGFYAVQANIVNLGSTYFAPHMQVLAKPNRWKRSALHLLPI